MGKEANLDLSGIVGYIGRSNSLEVVLRSMRRLPPTGEAHASVVFVNGKGIETYETLKGFQDLEQTLPSPLPRVRAALGRVTWKRHAYRSGESIVGAGEVIVVHSGAICAEEEHSRSASSAMINSKTKTLPHLIRGYLSQGSSLEESLAGAVSKIKGVFALCVICERYPDRLFAMRRGLPLAIGFADNYNLVASDIASLLEVTNDIVFMKDEELWVLQENDVKVFQATDSHLEPATPNAVRIDWTEERAIKNGHEHFMKKEIFEQPQAIADTIGEWVEHPGDFFSQIGVDTKTLLDMRRIHLVACGTSYHAALIGRYLIESLARIPVSVDVSSEYRFMKPITENGTLFVSVSQSGETADTVNAQREAKLRGAKTLTICNVEGSTAIKEADFKLLTRAGIEKGVTATKTFTSQIAALTLMALSLAIRRGRIDYQESAAIRHLLVKIPFLIETILSQDLKVEDLAVSNASARGFLYMGRGLNYPVALEAALKLKEVAYIHADACPAGEIKHGPIALIEEGVPVIAIAPSDQFYERSLSNIKEVKNRGGTVIAVSSEESLLSKSVDHLINVPSTHPVLSPILNVIPLQLLAYHIGATLGYNVDRPRSLWKSFSED